MEEERQERREERTHLPHRRGLCCGKGAESCPQSRWQLLMEQKMPRGDSVGSTVPMMWGPGLCREPRDSLAPVL